MGGALRGGFDAGDGEVCPVAEAAQEAGEQAGGDGIAMGTVVRVRVGPLGLADESAPDLPFLRGGLFQAVGLRQGFRRFRDEVIRFLSASSAPTGRGRSGAMPSRLRTARAKGRMAIEAFGWKTIGRSDSSVSRVLDFGGRFVFPQGAAAVIPVSGRRAGCRERFVFRDACGKAPFGGNFPFSGDFAGGERE